MKMTEFMRIEIIDVVDDTVRFYFIDESWAHVIKEEFYIICPNAEDKSDEELIKYIVEHDDDWEEF